MNQPSCIHTSTLMAGRPVEVFWAIVPQAQSYTLERKLTPLPGLEPQGGTPGYGDFAAVYTGGGEPSPVVHVGLPWVQIHGHGRSFDEIAASARSWTEVEALGERVSHVACADSIPEEADYIEYRVKAFGDGQESPYRYAEKFKINRFAEASDSLIIDVQSGDRVVIPLSAHMVMRYPHGMRLHYNDEDLQYEGAEASDFHVNLPQPGVLELRFTKTWDHQLLSGQIALLRFAALGTVVSELKALATGN